MVPVVEGAAQADPPPGVHLHSQMFALQKLPEVTAMQRQSLAAFPGHERSGAENPHPAHELFLGEQS